MVTDKQVRRIRMLGAPVSYDSTKVYRMARQAASSDVTGFESFRAHHFP